MTQKTRVQEAAARRMEAARAASEGSHEELARLLSLGVIGEQSLAGYEETDGVPYDLDDVLFWRGMPGVLPLNSYMYLAQVSFKV